MWTSGQTRSVHMFCNESSVAVKTSSVRRTVLAHGVTLDLPVTAPSALSYCSSQQEGSGFTGSPQTHFYIHSQEKEGKNTIFILGEKITTVRRSRVIQEELPRFHGELNKV